MTKGAIFNYQMDLYGSKPDLDPKHCLTAGNIWVMLLLFMSLVVCRVSLIRPGDQLHDLLPQKVSTQLQVNANVPFRGENSVGFLCS